MVTDVSAGTEKYPKSSLRNILEFGVFSEVKRLVGKGERFEGYLSVWQNDGVESNAEATSLTSLRNILI